MADHQRNIRLAMMLAINMRELPTMDAENMLMNWADNLIRYFGPGELLRLVAIKTTKLVKSRDTYLDSASGVSVIKCLLRR